MYVSVIDRLTTLIGPSIWRAVLCDTLLAVSSTFFLGGGRGEDNVAAEWGEERATNTDDERRGIQPAGSA